MQDIPESIENESVSLKIDYVPFVNFAMQQNGVALVRSLSVENASDETLHNISVHIWNDPPLFVEQTFRIDEIKPEAAYTISEPALTFLREPLLKQMEREEGNLWAAVTINNRRVVQKACPLAVLAYNEWSGSVRMPELLAAHILPNDPAVERILKNASGIP